MEMNAGKFDLLKRLIWEKMGETFLTKDVSEHPEMLEAHGLDCGDPIYNKSVGIFLSHNRARLGIDKDLTKTTSNARWIKHSGTSHAEKTSSKTKAVLSGKKSEDAEGLGPQSASDKPFTARMRLHQSWYRTHVLRVPFGTGPTPKSPHFYGNMLSKKEGAAGGNFLTSEIAEVARERLQQRGGTVEPFRLFHNMLSSQPMCFNLFGPLVKDAELARKLIDALVPERVARVLRVVIEWAPEPSAEYLNDRTAFDAFVEYMDVDGKKYALGIETKLTEPFSLTNVKDEKKYFKWMTLPGAPWKESAKDRFNNLAHNQLWRDHLLAFALENHRKSDYARCRLMLVRHPQDRECASVVETYRSFLKNEDSFIDMPLDRLFKHWNKVSLAQKQQDWLEAFFLRYLDLGESEPFIA